MSRIEAARPAHITCAKVRKELNTRKFSGTSFCILAKDTAFLAEKTETEGAAFLFCKRFAGVAEKQYLCRLNAEKR